MRKTLAALLAASIAVLASPGAAIGASPAIGSASSKISVATIAAAGKTVNIGVSSGLATTDAVKRGLGSLTGKAGMNFLAAELVGAASTPSLSVDATSDSPTDSEADAVSPLLDASSVSGNLTLTGMRADVDKALPSARSTLGQATIDLTVLDGIVSMSGVKIGVTNESNPTEAKSLQGIEIGSLGVLPLREVIDRATDLSADDLIDIATAFGGETTADDLGAVNTAKAEVIAAVEANDPELVDTSTSGQTLLACEAPLTPEICSQEQVSAAIATLTGAVGTLKDTLGDMPTVSLRNVTVGVMAVANDTASDSTAGASWGEMKVLGIDVPVTPGDVQASFTALNSKTAELQALINTLTEGLGAFTFKLTGPTLSPAKGKTGDYQTASSSVSALRAEASLPAAEGISSGLSLDGSLLTIAGDAEHRPTIIDPPGQGVPLANTGANTAWMVAGLLMLVAAYRLRRWLGETV